MAGKKVKLMNKLNVEAKELAVRKLLFSIFRKWKQFLKSQKKIFARFIGKPAVMAFMCHFFTSKTDWMDIYASCINGHMIRPKKVKSFTFAIEASIKTQLKGIVSAWCNWTSRIASMKKDTQQHLKADCFDALARNKIISQKARRHQIKRNHQTKAIIFSGLLMQCVKQQRLAETHQIVRQISDALILKVFFANWLGVFKFYRDEAVDKSNIPPALRSLLVYKSKIWRAFVTQCKS